MDTLKRNKDIWDYYQVKQRESFNFSRARFSFLFKIIRKKKICGKLLDIGLGDGALLEMGARNSFECYGIDIAEKSVLCNREKLKKLGIKADLRVSGISSIKHSSAMFDVITASEVLEHLTDDDLKEGIKEIKRCLKSGGFFIGTVPALENLEDSSSFCPDCGAVFHKWGHQQTFDEEKLKNLFCDFKSVLIKKEITPVQGLNLFGKTESVLKRLALKLKKPIKGATYVIVASKR